MLKRHLRYRYTTNPSNGDETSSPTGAELIGKVYFCFRSSYAPRISGHAIRFRLGTLLRLDVGKNALIA